jgi:hypothetical protein
VQGRAVGSNRDPPAHLGHCSCIPGASPIREPTNRRRTRGSCPPRRPQRRGRASGCSRLAQTPTATTTCAWVASSFTARSSGGHNTSLAQARCTHLKGREKGTALSSRVGRLHGNVHCTTVLQLFTLMHTHVTTAQNRFERGQPEPNVVTSPPEHRLERSLATAHRGHVLVMGARQAPSQ